MRSDNYGRSGAGIVVRVVMMRTVYPKDSREYEWEGEEFKLLLKN